MRNSAAHWTSWSEPAGVRAPWHSWADGDAGWGMAAGTGMLRRRLLLHNTFSSSNFLSAVKASGSWSYGFLKNAAGVTLLLVYLATSNK